MTKNSAFHYESLPALAPGFVHTQSMRWRETHSRDHISMMATLMHKLKIFLFVMPRFTVYAYCLLLKHGGLFSKKKAFIEGQTFLDNFMKGCSTWGDQ